MNTKTVFLGSNERGNRLMRIPTLIKFTALSLVLLVVASACSDGIDSASERISGTFSSESTSERLSSRADDTVERLQGAAEQVELRSAETVTLRELQSAGIPVGSHEIGCDDPLDLVLVEGMFDRENLFPAGVAMAGGSLESLAMRMVAEIYDPETDMPLGMIGDSTGGSLTGITQGEDGAIATGSVDSELVFSSADRHNEDRELVPERVCE
jgi:hypothetical protein